MPSFLAAQSQPLTNTFLTIGTCQRLSSLQINVHIKSQARYQTKVLEWHHIAIAVVLKLFVLDSAYLALSAPHSQVLDW